MKKIFAAIAMAAALMSVGKASAQSYNNQRSGIIIGGTSSSSDLKDAKTLSLYHVGLTTEIPIGLGFHFQPSIIYQMKGMALNEWQDASGKDIKESFETKVGYLEVPFQLQWGPDLIAFRPYVFGEPFVGYRLTDNSKGDTAKELSNELKKVEYGLGIGAGLEIWKLQFSAKYFWNFGGIYQSDIANTANTIKGLKDSNNFNGVAFSLAILF